MNARSRSAIDAIKIGDCKEVIFILSKHPEIINEPLQDGKSPLHLAVESGNLKLVQVLAETKGIHLNIRAHTPNTNLDGMTPVFMASYLTPNADILNYLIQLGADTSIATTNGQTPLTVATYANMQDRVLAIVATNNSNVNSVIIGGYTALTNAVEKGDVTMVKTVLTIPGNKIINNKKGNGESALFIAASQGHVEKVVALLRAPEIDITASRIPGDGKTALQVATESSHTEVINLIKQKQLLLDIRKIINLDELAKDPLIESPLLIKRLDTDQK